MWQLISCHTPSRSFRSKEIFVVFANGVMLYQSWTETQMLSHFFGVFVEKFRMFLLVEKHWKGDFKRMIAKFLICHLNKRVLHTNGVPILSKATLLRGSALCTFIEPDLYMHLSWLYTFCNWVHFYVMLEAQFSRIFVPAYAVLDIVTMAQVTVWWFRCILLLNCQF